MGCFSSPKAVSAPTVNYNAPSMYNDPNYAGSQSSLMPFASALMSGKGLPPAYADLGQSNSPQFQAMLKNATGNILGATQDQMAGQGIGDSGVAASAAAGAVGNTTSQLTWQDFLNSQSNQMNMMQEGAGIMENVGSMALTNQGQTNEFNLSNASQSLDASKTNASNAIQTGEFNDQMQEQQNQMWGQMISAGIGAIGNVAGMGMLGGFGGSGTGTPSVGTNPMNNGWGSFTSPYQKPDLTQAFSFSR
jgi:hypothetical protein